MESDFTVTLHGAGVRVLRRVHPQVRERLCLEDAHRPLRLLPGIPTDLLAVECSGYARPSGSSYPSAARCVDHFSSPPCRLCREDAHRPLRLRPGTPSS